MNYKDAVEITQKYLNNYSKKENADGLHIEALQTLLSVAPGISLEDGLCYYCREKTNNLSGNPSMWCVMLPHKDEPGVVKPHHIGCVVERLEHGWKKIEKTELSKIICQFIIEKQSARRAGQNTMYADKLSDIIIKRMEK